MSEMVCFWREDEDGIWMTACREEFVFLVGGPEDNKVRFCCYCGGQLHPVPYVWVDEAESDPARLTQVNKGKANGSAKETEPR